MKKNNLQGFTLIELIIVIAILGIAIAIAAPNLTETFRIAQVKGVAENLAQDLVMAKAEAIRSNQPISLNMRSSCYGLILGATSCNCTITDITNTNYCAIKQVSMPSNVSLTIGTNFNNILFENVRGMPVTSTFGNLTSTQSVTIGSNTGNAVVNMNIIGNTCISSPSGSKKIGAYPNAC